MILQGLKPWLDNIEGLWVQELYSIIWAYHTTHWLSMCEMPFSLTFGIEIVILLEVSLPSHHVEAYDEEWNLEDPRINLDLLEEIQDKVRVWLHTSDVWLATSTLMWRWCNSGQDTLSFERKLPVNLQSMENILQTRKDPTASLK